MNSSGRAGLGQPEGGYCQTVREDSCSTWCRQRRGESVMIAAMMVNRLYTMQKVEGRECCPAALQMTQGASLTPDHL